MFCVTSAVSFAVAPLLGSVTVRMYVPATLTVGVNDVDVKPLGPLHNAVAPLVVDDPFNCIDVVVQVKILSAPAFTFGGVVSCVTIIVSFDVQPFVGFVTVRMYVPATLTVGVNDVDVKPLGPLHDAVVPLVVDDPSN